MGVLKCCQRSFEILFSGLRLCFSVQSLNVLGFLFENLLATLYRIFIIFQTQITSGAVWITRQLRIQHLCSGSLPLILAEMGFHLCVSFGRAQGSADTKQLNRESSKLYLSIASQSSREVLRLKIVVTVLLHSFANFLYLVNVWKVKVSTVAWQG